MMRQLGFFLILNATLACPAYSQVIEIDSTGAAQTYSGPTLFTATTSVPIETRRRVVQRATVSSEMITSTALAHGLNPRLLQAVAWQELRGRVNALSSKGAMGVMQLMPGTAAELNVDPRIASENLRGGALYLRQQLDRFGGNVPLALAAYNAGPGAVLRFGGIPPYRETQNYVGSILRRWQEGAEFSWAKTTTEVAE